MVEAFADAPLSELLKCVEEARERIRPHAHLTPVMTSAMLDERAGARVFLKCENLQRGGAFKFRGAYNAMSRIPGPERARGAVAYSSGNHAQAVALVGRTLGIPVTVVMPDDASETKRQATVGYGARVIGCRASEREAVAAEAQRETGATLIPPFDHPDVIAGQGTLALEFLEQAPDIGAILAPVGGGGLISGIAIAARGANEGCRVIGVEPELCDDAARSLASGKLETSEACESIADGTRTRSLGKITFPLMRRLVDAVVTVSEDEIAEAVQFLFHRMKLVVEPSGALGVAALLSGKFAGKERVGVVLSGGNIDGRVMARLLAEAR